MNKDQRQAKLVEIINEKKKISVNDLAEIFAVSTVTMRKDLTDLDSAGLIRRTHNFAELIDDDSISQKLSFHFKEKTEIAQKAVDLVSDGETIMVESGSCCAIFAKKLAETKKNITIITNSIFIADYIRDSSVQVIVIGGIYQAKSQVLIGPVLAESVKNYKVDKLFIGADGYSFEWGFSNKDPFRGEAVRHMAERCDSVIVLTESHKFATSGCLSLGLVGKVDRVVTDKNINKKAKDHLKASGIKLILS
ncbi:DeoR/GlpR family DNA-binding transcription regulator [uncultured Anaerococcus sp.]|uniref:DeoR/GlpR family DNA-binding transcription regulator n=1 Tax=uncultured Anaerococcus sp. TaxID=293428 RepID=UPI00288A819F|nr:DeoR/GlpR family DNA-binding transcription regulator [uncultured Anaerococcus sp.]